MPLYQVRLISSQAAEARVAASVEALHDLKSSVAANQLRKAQVRTRVSIMLYAAKLHTCLYIMLYANVCAKSAVARIGRSALRTAMYIVRK